MARILLVDDDDSLRMAMRMALIFQDHEVLPAATAAAGIQLFDERGPDLVICDVYLPGNGLTVLEHVRGRVAPVPVIMITGRPCRELREQVRHQGAILETKPIDLDRFRAVVAEELEKGRA